jgi:peptidoglycan/LPS O-acetylase OafA/YrhL
MRHLFGFFLGVVLVAVASVVLVFGLGEVVAREGRVSTTGFTLLCVAGVLFGLLVVLRRMSPLAPLVGGLLLLAAGIAAWVRPAFYADVRTGVDQLQAGLPVVLQLGIALLLGSLLVVVGLLPGGRRRVRETRDERDDREDRDDDYTVLPRSEPEAWRSPSGPGTNAYPTATPYQRPPLDRPPS